MIDVQSGESEQKEVTSEVANKNKTGTFLSFTVIPLYSP